jgi:hypothetical protein
MPLLDGETSRIVTVDPDAALRPVTATPRIRCGGCGGSDLVTVLDLGTSPLADAFPLDAYQNEARFPLRVGVCGECWLAQLLDIVPGAVLYGGDYGYHSAASPSTRDYHTAVAGALLSEYRDLAERLTVEVACNDGDLLTRFDVARCPTLGVEPAANVAEEARKRGLSVVADPFSTLVAEDITATHGRAGLVVANNVAAHVEDLPDFVAGLAALVAADGAVSVEVQYVADLLAGNQFDHVYHEHRSFFSVDSFARVAERAGLPVRRVVHTAAQGGSVRLLCGGGVNADGSVERARAGESWLRRSGTWEGLQGRAEYLRDRLVDLLDGQRRRGRHVAGYAASAKSTTLLNWCHIGPDRLGYVVDTTPLKIGRVTPGTHVPIVAPGVRPDPDVYLLMAWNYLPGVLRRERAFLDAGGRFLVPTPAPALL